MLDVCWQFRTIILEHDNKDICKRPFRKQKDSRHPFQFVSLWNMWDIFTCKWVKQWIEVGFNSNMILETFHERQDKPVSSGGCDMSALCCSLQPLRQSWLSCLALNLNGKGRWRQNQDIVGDRGWGGGVREDRRKKRADVDWGHWQGESEWGEEMWQRPQRENEMSEMAKALNWYDESAACLPESCGQNDTYFFIQPAISLAVAP